jgi:HEAT repeat protein
MSARRFLYGCVLLVTAAAGAPVAGAPNGAADPELVERTAGELTVVLARSVSPYARMEAARALRFFESPSTVMALVQALSDSSVRTAAANSLVAIGPDVVPVLVEALQDKAQRRHVIEVLPRFGPDAADAVPALESILENDETHRDLAAGALGAIGPRAASAIPAVQAVYEDVLAPDWASDVTSDERGPVEGDIQEISRFGAKRRRRIAAHGALVGMEHRPTILVVIDDRLASRELKVAAVGKLGADDVALLVSALGDQAEPIRVAAAGTLGVLGEAARPAIPHLAETLGDVKPGVREVAASALGQLALCCAGDVQRAMDEAIERCGSGGMLTSAPLERIGPPVVTGCLHGIDHEEAACRVLAAVTLVRLDAMADEAIGALERALQDNDVAVRGAVVTELLEHPEMTRAVQGAVLERFTDSDTAVRESAVQAAWVLDARDADVAVAFRLALGDSESGVRWRAARAFHGVDPLDAETVAALIDVLAHGGQFVGSAAARALVPAARRDAQVRAALFARLDDPHSRLPRAAAEALGESGAEGVAMLVGRLNEPSNMGGSVAPAYGIAAAGPTAATAASAVPKLITMLQRRSPRRRAVEEALAAIGPAAEEAVIAALRNPEQHLDIRHGAIRILARMRSQRAVEALLWCVENCDQEMLRAEAAKALAEVGPFPAAVPVLVDVLHRDVPYRWAAAKALGATGTFDEDVVSALLVASRDADRSTAASAAVALGRVLDRTFGEQD